MVYDTSKERIEPDKSILGGLTVRRYEFPGLEEMDQKLTLALGSTATPSIVFDGDTNVTDDHCFFGIVKFLAGVRAHTLAAYCPLWGSFFQ